jgi:mercuric reductase
MLVQHASDVDGAPRRSRPRHAGYHLGVAMVGLNAGEVIYVAAMAMRYRAKIHNFIDLQHVFPTMAEALKIVAISRYKNPAKLSCCAE